MWWITLVVGLVGVALGMRQLVLAFVGGAEGGRGVTATEPAIRFVRGAMYVTGGLFVAFLSLANLIAVLNGSP